MALLAIGIYWIGNQEKVGGAPWLLRSVHELNEKIWSAVFSDRRHPPKIGSPAGTKPRVNGDIGLLSVVDVANWRMQVFVEDKLVHTLSIGDLRKLPQTSTATEFYCIEGWSTQFSYAGVKFSDFMKAYGPSLQYLYVGLETPDQKYYVSIDMPSMMHEQTLLADEMNERPLSSANGAPLRLVIPIKYGIKSLKRIGSIRFSNT